VLSMDLLRGTYFRFALALTSLFVLSNLVAGWIAFQSIHHDLDGRVEQAAALMSAQVLDTYEADGQDALLADVEARAASLDPEDDIVWLGRSDGTYLAGHPLPDPGALGDGDVTGTRLGQDDDDTYLLISRRFDDLRLITARSYEETDDIASTILKAFGGATFFVSALAGLAAIVLSRNGRARIDRISSVLRKVASGDMKRRIDTRGHQDDLGLLSERINEALGQLEATVSGIRQVSADIAHDLRTPINRLGIQIERLRSESESYPNLEAHLDLVTDEIRQITATFDALLRISQIEAGARKAKFRAVPLSEVAAALSDVYTAVAEDSDQVLSVSTFANTDTLVFGDRDLLIQLGANLIENAIRHAGPGAKIWLETGSGHNGVWMSVGDNGPGIPPEEHERVLGRFYRLDKSRHTPGSGLGLALVEAIADLHGASLRLSNANPGLLVRVDFARFDEALRSDAR